jgi:hypothetical protein
MLCSGQLVWMAKAAEMTRKTGTGLKSTKFREELARNADCQATRKMRAFIGE